MAALLVKQEAQPLLVDLDSVVSAMDAAVLVRVPVQGYPWEGSQQM